MISFYLFYCIFFLLIRLFRVALFFRVVFRFHLDIDILILMFLFFPYQISESENRKESMGWGKNLHVLSLHTRWEGRTEYLDWKIFCDRYFYYMHFIMFLFFPCQISEPEKRKVGMYWGKKFPKLPLRPSPKYPERRTYSKQYLPREKPFLVCLGKEYHCSAEKKIFL